MSLFKKNRPKYCVLVNRYDQVYHDEEDGKRYVVTFSSAKEAEDELDYLISIGKLNKNDGWYSCWCRGELRLWWKHQALDFSLKNK